MQREVLDYLYAQGELVLAIFPGNPAPREALEKYALALNAGASFVLFDYSRSNNGNTGIALADLYTRALTNDELQTLQAKAASGLVFGGFSAPPNSEESFRLFYRNLQQIKAITPHVVGLFSGKSTENIDSNLVHIAKLILIGCENADDASALVEDSPALQKGCILWLNDKAPDKKRFPRTFKAVRRGFSKYMPAKLTFGENPQAFAENTAWILKGEILRKNPMDGIPKLFCILFPLLLVAAILLPFIYPTNVDASHSNMRDRIPERNKIAMAPSFEYTFDGKENLWRIARYALGRFNAVISNEKMIRDYLDETIQENGYKGGGWEKNIMGVPPQGTVIKFTRPTDQANSSADSIGAAWKYWTSIFSDSIAYITEFYHERATSQNRKHNGIDVAGRQGARILAPFSAKAFTKRDERGGIVIGLVREKDVMLFMHCDQLLYLDGQEVMQGDPIATVGMTGHTTGPHAHIVTGLVDKRGGSRIGNVSYKVIDPITWYYKFKPTSSR
ncbi:M23 family metallopeptidase [Fibrobacter sp. UBA2449]|uniref:M23 family metallopeptidase n=1 Tax=Fibrobacter sp. UBA2449 TaxID=1946529 RepID=UPI0025C092D6|nr:M23 family metallopeptidase [Fibrobacter sp. UBA2449]